MSDPDVGSAAPAQRRRWSWLSLVLLVVAVLVAAIGGAVLGDLLVRHDDTSTTGSEATCRATSVAYNVLPSVVTIAAAAQGGQSGTGSGEVFRDGGYILTNQHVIAPAGQHGDLTVRYSDGTESNATLVGEDVTTDLAVIKADDGANGRPVIGCRRDPAWRPHHGDRRRRSPQPRPARGGDVDPVTR